MKRSGFTPKIKPLSGILRTAQLKADGKPTLASKPKTRKCSICKTSFEKRSMAHVACSPSCALEIARLKREKFDRKALAARKQDLRPRKWWLAKAKTALHAYIRARDEGKSCISCETILTKLGRVGGDYDAGHFRSVGSAKHLEFVEDNIHGQCKHCNDYLKGNHEAYERGLVIRFEQSFVDLLKSDQAPRHLTITDLQMIEAKYKAKLKELQLETRNA